MRNDLGHVFVTGADGMVGSYVDFGIRTSRKTLDITDFEKTQEIIRDHNPKIILHLAAQTDVKVAEENPERTYFVNTIGTYNIAEASKKIGAKLVHISTVGVFNGTKKEPYTLNDSPSPHNHYGRSKYIGEIIVRELLEDYIIIRPGWMFGGGPKKDKKFIAKIIRQLEKPQIEVVDDQFGTLIFAKDLVHAIKQLILDDATGIYHIANEGFVSRYEVAREIVKIAGAETKITAIKLADPGESSAVGKNEGLLSSVPLRSWKDALREYIETEWPDRWGG